MQTFHWQAFYGHPRASDDLPLRCLPSAARLRGTKLLTGPIRTYEVNRPVRIALAKLGL